MNTNEVVALLSYVESGESKEVVNRSMDIAYIIQELEQAYEYAKKTNIPRLELERLIGEYKEMLKDCTLYIRDKALEHINNKNELSEPECNEDCCNCRTCRYWEEGPIQWGFADGEQVFGEGMCHEDDRRIVGKATGHKPCPGWKSVNDTSPDIDWP